jgi:hypothetical protein
MGDFVWSQGCNINIIVNVIVFARQRRRLNGTGAA